ncbi:NADH dehydrogenase (ubiquinone) [[Leptolyngbya] sp. PCC 7376]|uniref:NAD(P)/FAD-dependent oxidoreductase n=1 Tax=[Leptolyngbya] sp. PCC 7376 TaxID=111781 RepID=UPI00029ECF66|nr:NAD(P)/FAD-dependent oxidoreductase [[Leptolyngbya] sp. PCC 7376]AFY36752.1 NADH dehydrogenase (ubiquinone) [[Leptolyngbya] sp. PCC 7376]
MVSTQLPDLTPKTDKHKVVIIGGGFGGLYAAKTLGKNGAVDVTLIDKRNFHLFQPLLYQVATGTLSPADIASPLRGILSRNENTHVLLDQVQDVDPETKTVVMTEGTVQYDSLVVATGVSHHYFGNDQWKPYAPGLKTVEDALEIRHRIFAAFEAAEKETDPALQQAWLTFVIIGGGPTGVELAGAISEIAYSVLKKDFRKIDTAKAKVILLEGMDRVLPPYDPSLSAKAQQSLESLGVDVQTSSLVTNIEGDRVTVKQGEEQLELHAKTIVWAAGVKASGMGKVLGDRLDANLDRAGRVIVEPNLSVEGYPDVFVIGDLANFPHQNERPLPGVAPVAMQEGQYVAKLIKQRIQGNEMAPFRYTEVGSLAVIGQNAAVVDLGYVKFSGFLAWLVWIFAHVYYLIEFDNKMVVMIQWGWNYFTRGRGARLITGEKDLANGFKLYQDYAEKDTKVNVKVEA